MAQFRADRLLTLYAAQPARRLMPLDTGRVPILMYHSISRETERRVHPYYQTVTTPEKFSEQIDFLHRNGYKTVTLTDAIGRMQTRQVSERAVVITFDDGYQDFYTEAFPVLSLHSYSATVFLPTAYIGESAQKFKGRECLTWNQVRELKAAGIDFGSHTVTHPQLKTLKLDAIQYEVQSSKLTIEAKLGSAVESFSYPYALPEADHAFRQTLKATLQEAGYGNGVSTIIGTAGGASDKFFMERLPVNCSDDLRLFQAKLQGAYDWLHTVQYAWKALSSRYLGWRQNGSPSKVQAGSEILANRGSCLTASVSRRRHPAPILVVIQ